MGLARVALVVLAATAATLAADARARADGATIDVTLVCDRDDDDADGVADADEARLPRAARADLVALDPRLAGATLAPLSGAGLVRVLAKGAPVAWGRALPAGAELEGVSPGRAELVATKHGSDTRVSVVVRQLGWKDGARRLVDPARDHASLERTPPERVEGGPDAAYTDPDALRVVQIGPAGAPAPATVSVSSVSANGVAIDELASVALAPYACGAGLACAASEPLRFVVDDVDRRHPLVVGRSLRAEVGGAIVVRAPGMKQAIRVLGPRASPAGPIARLRATLRPIVVRTSAGGAPSVGGTDAGAIALVRHELAAASAVWGQCGVSFGPPDTIDVKLANPPPSHLVAFGADAAIPATGATLRVRVDGRAVSSALAPGASALDAALAFARAVEHAGFVAVVSANARITAGARETADVSVRKRDGALATVELAAPVGDATMRVRIGSVDLDDGLEHFSDTDSVSGTLEERTLVKAFDDGDPRTIEVLVVRRFSGTGRIGESFIAGDGSSVRDVVLVDRAGIRARRASSTIAHELGHVLTDEPGHPDDFGVDTPTSLMDSDAADASAFGPRRLSVAECARMVRASGPGARVPLLVAWPLGRLAIEPTSR